MADEYRTDGFELGAALGLSRLLNDFQFQEIEVADRLQGTEQIVQLDRQRFVGAVKSALRVAGDRGRACKA